jgi:hypothetical protein
MLIKYNKLYYKQDGVIFRNITYYYINSYINKTISRWYISIAYKYT